MPKTSFKKKVLDHDKRVKDISKICIKLPTWKNHTELFLSPDCFLITESHNEGESQLHEQEMFSSITVLKLLNIRVKISQVFYNWSTSIFMWCLKCLAWKKGKGNIPKLRKCVNHETWIHSTWCSMPCAKISQSSMVTHQCEIRKCPEIFYCPRPTELINATINSKPF